MPDDLFKKASDLWGGFRKKAAETVAGQEVAFARGKTAARDLLDESGNTIVLAGHTIDDAVIDRATAAGKLHALAQSALSASAQDLREKVQEKYVATDDGREAQSLGSVEDYVEARRYVGRHAGVDVTDIRGNVILQAGAEIMEEDVQAARREGQLRALIFSAQQPLPEGVEIVERKTRYQLPSTPIAPSPTARPLVPLADWPEESEPTDR